MNLLSSNILTIESTPKSIKDELRERVKQRRLELQLTQETLAQKADIPLSTYRYFERTGQISLDNLLHIAFALDCLSDFEQLFAKQQYTSLDEAMQGNAHTRKRGSK